MAVGTISSVITARFVQNLELARAGESSRTLSGSEATKVTLSGLQLGSQVFSNAIKGLNNVYNFLDFTETDLESLSKITNEMITLVERAAKNGIGTNTRSSLNSKFEDLATKFKNVIEDSKRGDYSDISVKDIASIFQSVGLSKESSSELASIVNSFIVSENSDGEEVLVSDQSQAKRPVRIPSSAYTNSSRGIGDGTFSPALSVEGGRLSSVLADVNNDSFLDVVGINSGSTDTIITLGNGDGSFKAPTTISGGIETKIAYDIDGDNNVDLIGYSSSQIAVRLGNGDGSFNATVTYQGISSEGRMQLANIDGDAELELLNVNNDDTVSIFQGNSDGSFDLPSSYTIGNNAGTADLRIADFDNDGSMDMLIADRFDGDLGLPGRLILARGNGDGTFLEPEFIESGIPNGFTEVVEVADFNGDGFMDFIANDNTAGKMVVRLGNNDGTFAAPVSFTSTALRELKTTDVNSDGFADIIGAANGHLSIHLGNGDGTFKAEVTYTTGHNSSQINYGDVDNDGAIDIAVANSSGDSFSLFEGVRAANYNSLKDYTTLFATGRNIRTRAGAFMMLSDLKALKEQLDTNLEAISKAKSFVFKNIQLASATGFAFLETASNISETQNDPDTIVSQIRQKLRRADPRALSQLANLDPITTAALTTSY